MLKAVSDDVDVVGETKARRIHSVLEEIRPHDVGGDDRRRRRSVRDELYSFANTVNGLDLPSSQPDHHHHQGLQHELSYSDRLMQTRADWKRLERLVSDTFHWTVPHDSTALSQSTADQPRTVDPVHLTCTISHSTTMVNCVKGTVRSAATPKVQSGYL